MSGGDVLTVRVTGSRSGSGPVTWGQQAIWKSVVGMARDGGWVTVRRLVTVSAGRHLTPEAATAAVGRLVELHETLRTRFAPGPDGALCQELDATGELHVPVIAVDAAPGAPTGDSMLLAEGVGLPLPQLRVIDELIDERLAVPLRPDRDWPLWVALVTVDGDVRHLLVVLNHVAVDWFASDLLVRDLRLLLTGRDVPAPRGLRPLDLAAREQAEPARTERALRYWRDAATGLAGEQLPVTGPGAEHRYLECRLESAALAEALEVVAARHAVSTATVAAAAVCAVLGRYDRRRRAGLLLIVDNRFQPGHEAVVAPMNQLGLFTLDLRGTDPADPATLHDLVPRAWAATLSAYRHARYDQGAMDAMLLATGLGTDADVEPRCCLNDIRAGLRGRSAPAAPAGPPGPARPSRTMLRPLQSLNWNLYVELRDHAEGILLVCQSDTRRIPPAALEQFTRDVERYVVGAASRSSTDPVSTDPVSTQSERQEAVS